nr:glycosyltransferase family 4 protein [Elusimicrobiota bacterium]
VEDIVTTDKSKYHHTVAYIKEFGETGERIKKAGVEVVKLSSFLKILKYVKNKQPDIIHTHLFRANILGRIAGKLTSVSVVSSRQSTDTWRKWYHKSADIWTARYCKAIIANSKKVKELMIKKEKVPPEKIKVVYIGISKIWFKTVTDKKRGGNTIGFVGRLHPEKGADLIPDFAAKLNAATGKSINIKIAGGGKLEDYLKERVPSNVYLTGWKSGKELMEFYDSVDLLFMLSRMESIPRVIIEAGARKLPAVAPDLGGIGEIIKDGKNGFLYGPGEMDEAVSKITGYLKHPDPSVSEDIYKTAAQFTVPKTVKEIIEIYNSLNQV